MTPGRAHGIVRTDAPKVPLMPINRSFLLVFALVASAALPPARADEPRPRARAAGVVIGTMAPGPRNAITDVDGVGVGHATLVEGTRLHTGVTAIVPHPGNLYRQRVPAAIVVGNGYGKLAGITQVRELGELETPVLLTGTLSTWKVADAAVDWLLRQPGMDNVRSINPVVGETNDGYLSDIRARPLTPALVEQALTTLSHGEVEEGGVGAGAGTVAFGWKGGIGTSSRRLVAGEGGYTIGVLVQSNHGCLEELTVCNRRLGEEIIAKRNARPAPEPNDRGSIMMVTATDLPVSDRQLRRIIKRCSVGLARCGSYFGHGSGDVMIGFTTANRMPAGGMHRVIPQQVLTEHTLELAFRAIAEATQEAVLNSLCCADAVTAEDGRVFESISKYL